LRSANQKQIAERLGLSQATVSMVLNDDPRISKDTRERVFEVIEELDYRPDGIARSFVNKKTGNIGFILCDRMISSPSYFRMIHGVDRSVSRQGRKLLFTSAREFIAEKSKFPLILKEKILDGAIVSGKVSSEFVVILKNRGIPTVLLGSYDIENVDIVTPDSKKGAFEAVSYLISLGHRRIGFIAGSFSLTVHREQLDGYKKAYEEAGFNYDKSFIQENAEENATNMVEQMLKIPEQPTAIFAANDMIAINVMEILRGKGLSIPEDMSIVGSGDIEIASHTTPRLTTVRIFDEKMAELAVKRLVEIIDGGSQNPVRKTVGIELIIRESCGFIADQNSHRRGKSA